jgi:hypothetical protein
VLENENKELKSQIEMLRTALMNLCSEKGVSLAQLITKSEVVTDIHAMATSQRIVSATVKPQGHDDGPSPSNMGMRDESAGSSNYASAKSAFRCRGRRRRRS